MFLANGCRTGFFLTVFSLVYHSACSGE